MDGPPARFAAALVSRKDQPCLLLPAACGQNAPANERLLTEAVSAGELTVKRGGGKLPCPLQVLPIVVADSGAGLFRIPCGIPVAAGADCFDLPQCAAAAAGNADLTDYWSGFLAFTVLHLEDLRRLLEEHAALALAASAARDYTAEHAAMLGAMEGVGAFLELFWRELSLRDRIVQPEGWLEKTAALLEDGAAQYEAPEGLADIFLAAAGAAIRRRDFPCYRLGLLLPSLPRGAVYFDRDYICLDRPAFQQICLDAGCQPGAVKQDLAELGYFAGKAVNRQSYETRISLRCGGAKAQLVRVYKFQRELFEPLG